jgi:hypothetical protein
LKDLYSENNLLKINQLKNKIINDIKPPKQSRPKV